MSSTPPAPGAYIKDLAYHSAFQGVQAPAAMSFVAGSQGFEPPDPAQPFRYLELGCGEGATLNALAAACPQGEFIGVDFNRALLDTAQGAAGRAGLENVRYVEAAFSGLATSELRGCHYLACNGTWSWLDRAEKAALVRVIDDCLVAGGLLYLGYASLGRHAITPMWHILRQLVPAGAASSLERMRAGIELLLTLRDGGALFLAEHPQVLNVLNTVQRQLAAGDRSGLENLAHNALAEAYGTSLVDEVAAELAPAGLTFCGTADLFLNDPDLCLPDSVRVAHDQLGSRLQKELLRDFMRSSAGRRDVFSRRPGGDDGSLWLTRRAQATLTLPREAARQQLATPAWTAFRYGSPEIEFVFERLADGATSLQEVALDSVYTPENLSDAYLKLVACPGIEPCIRRPAEVRSGLQRRLAPGSPFNALALRAAGAGPVQLASPVLGSCIELPGPAGRVVAGLCGCGPDPNLEALDPASRQWLLREQLPLLVRLGVLTAE